MLVKADCVFNWVRYRLKNLFIRAEDELFLLEFNLVRFVDFTLHKLDRLHNQRNDEHLGRVLLFVAHDRLHVRTQLDLVIV